MSKANKHVFKNENFQLTECADGYWLYDFVLGFNLSMRAKTEQEAFIEALTRYQNKVKKLTAEYKDLDEKVQKFVEQFKKED